MEDGKILELYFARDERAITETEQKYGGYCYTLADSILHNRQDAEETLSDTLLHAWNAIPPQRPNVLKMYLAKITRNLAFTLWRSGKAQKRGGGELELVLEELEGCISASGSVEDALNAKELAARIRSFLNTLPEREQAIFLRRYFFLEETALIASRYGMKSGSVLKVLSRTREKLRKFLTQEGYTV